ncbi:TMEM165/GDT1 family protein [Sphingomonas sp. QA11]|uniref:TMEM165/GDT1 family protein n=1 Tax=Sphingomonas sp. QA11 TaxID=2950605 RepID=UPI002349E348|nr:TMEM165/GDT1 family protein [Sphingomonas sp. QA11]WCM26370.1 TMEM165/GDT1 family protein [Sphingomonas sp. QA11]
MAAFVAAILAQASDRTPWLTAILSTRFARPGAVIAGTAIALAIINAIGAIGGAIIGPRMVPNAQTLLLALALILAGGSALFPIKPPDRLSGWRIGAFLTSLVGVAILGFGDRTQFITAALAARSPTPALAAVGATIGAIVVNVAAILTGEEARGKLPLAAIRITIGILFLVVGAILGFSALRLI